MTEKVVNLQEKNNFTIDVIIGTIAIISLIASFTNFIPVSALISVTIIFLPYLLLKRKKSALTWILFIVFAYFSISTIIYNYKSLLNYNFYRRDGNIFITFAPLLILTLVKFKCKTEKIVDIFIIISTIINLITMFIFLIVRNTQEYFFLFYAHNAAGGFITTLLCMCVGKFIVSKNKIYLFCSIVNVIGLYLTDSRGSIIGLIIGIICLIFIYKDKFKNMDKILFTLCIIGITILVSCILSILWEVSLQDNGQNFNIPNQFQDSVFDKSLAMIGRSNTIVNRVFYLWPRALKLFTNSPILGMGFGSYNDIPYNISRIVPYLLATNTTSNIVYSDSHAHNSFFHIAAETGIIGLALVIVLLLEIRKTILSLEDKALKYSLYFSLITIIFSSFTEHRLFTPSQVLPFTIILGLVIAEQNYRKEHNKKELIVINGRFLTQKITGVQRYAIEITKKLDEISDKDIILIHPKNTINEVDLKNIKKVELKVFNGYIWEQVALPIYLYFKFYKYNIKLLNLCNIAPVLFPGYVTLHDISFKTNSTHLNKKMLYIYRTITLLNIKRYKKIFTVSEFSKKEIVKNYKIEENKIVVTYNSAEHIKETDFDKEILEKLNLNSEEYYFTLGSKSPHKNFEFILKCAEDNPGQVFVISGGENKKIFNNQQEKKLENVKYTGYLNDSELLTLYSNCKAFIFPSKYEGFGIPPLEAVITGCKNIILSDIPVFREVYGEYANYVDIYSDEKIILNKCNKIDNINNLINKYSWKKAAKLIDENL